MEEGDTSCPRMYGRLLKFHWRGLILLIVPFIFLPLIIPNYERHLRCVYIFSVMSAYWLTDAVPMYVTGLLPVVLMPLMGLLDSSVVCKCYFTSTLAIFVGCGIVALGLEYSNLHNRIAIGLITTIGCSPKRLLLGLILTSGFTSMWMQNKAVTAFMLPITKAVLDEFEAGGLKIKEDRKPDQEEEQRESSSVATGFYLAVCYASTIGGCGTLIGSPTHISFKGIYETSYPNATEFITFPGFLVYNLPWVLLALFLLYLTLLITHFALFRPKSETGADLLRFSESSKDVAAALKQKYENMGRISLHEVQILILYILMIILLILQSPDIIRGWADLIQEKKRFIIEATPIIIIMFMLFYLPVHYAFYKLCCGHGPFAKTLNPLLSWQYINSNFPWGVIFVLGSGYALAKAFKESGLSLYLQDNVKVFNSLPLPVLQIVTILFATLITTCCANVAASNIVVLIVGELARSIKTHPLNLIFPAGLGSSIAFLLPISTLPNRLVAEYANINWKKMAIAGIAPTYTSILLISLTCLSLHFMIYPAAKEFPDWVTLTKK